MSRPPAIPFNDVSSRTGAPINDRSNNIFPPSQRTENGSPRPRRVAPINNNNDNMSPPSHRVDNGSPHQRPNRPGDSIPNRGDMEALLRQWTSSSRELSSREPLNDVLELRIDRSASFDDERTDPRGSPRRGGAGATYDDEDDDVQNRHRRIASMGGNRQPIELDIPQMFDFDARLDSLIDGTSDGNDMILNGNNMSALHDAARITDWPSVAALSETNPESAMYVGPDGWNALHHACDRRCPHVDVIDSLLTAYPEALVQTNDKGWTPLHRACRNKTPRDVVKLLLRKYPELGKRAAGMRCNDGRSSLHYALLYDAPEGVVDLLLQADPNAVLDEDRDGVSPLGTVWDKYANTFDGRRMLQILLRPFEGEGWELGGNVSEGDSSFTPPPPDKLAAEKRVREAMTRDAPACKTLQVNWNRANTLLRAYFRFPLQEEKTVENNEEASIQQSSSGSSEAMTSSTRKRKWRVLHATSAIKCHPKLFLLARALHPEEALEIDENDLYASGSLGRPFGGDGNKPSASLPDPQSSPISKRTALHFAAMSQLSDREGRNVIKVLLKLNPNAAGHVDGYGSLPLHLICQNVRKLPHWTNFGIKDVYEAYREGVSCRDGMGRTPLHCVASTSGQYKCIPLARPSLPGFGGVGGPTTTGIAPAALVSSASDGQIRAHAPVAMEHSAITNLVNASPTTASLADDTGRLPLHYIAERTEEWTHDAFSILNAYPAAASTRAGPSTSNQLPLHMAASSPDARPSLIMNLVDTNPRAASLMDGTGRLPLHLAVDLGRTTWDRGINAIYEAYRPAIFAPEDSTRRWTVLHAASASPSAGRELIEQIISLSENGASVSDGEGRYPLHLACASNHRSWEEGGVRAIFDADPLVALSEDVHGLLPFHIAAMRCSVPTNSNAVAENAEADSEPENEGLESAATREDVDDDDLESLEVLFNLLIAQPSVVQI